MSIGGLGLHGITISPRFIFGVNGDLKNNLHLIDEHKLLYTAGHNAVVYSNESMNASDSTQYFLPGLEKTDKITAVAVSKSKKYLAICEKTERALCTIYDVHSQKKRKTIPDPDIGFIGFEDYQSMEFLSVAFNPKHENKGIITLCGQPDWLLLLWDWDKIQVTAKINIGLQGLPPQVTSEVEGEEPDFNFQISYNPHETQYILVTGPDTFKYYELEDKEFNSSHTQVNDSDPNRKINTRFTCHAWMSDGKLAVCNEVGQIILCETDGSYKAYIPDSPTDEGVKIDVIQPYSRGFIIAGHEQIFVYERTEDPSAPYRMVTAPIQVKMESKDLSFGNNMSYEVTSMALSHSEEHVNFLTSSNQFLRCELPLYDGADSRPKFEFVHCQNHTQEITGLDVCIRKQLIATCSTDKTIKIWNYANKSLEISNLLTEEALAVAFHPSGFHVVVAIQDKILFMNILSKALQQFKSIPVKGCREIKFSNGGHLFAAAHGNNASYVYNFYTYNGDTPPPRFQCKNHLQKVRSIDWFDDDSGFCSVSQGGDCYFWDLINDIADSSGDATSSRLVPYDVSWKAVSLTGCVNIPGRNKEVYCVGNDGKIWNTSMHKEPFEAQASMSQVSMTANGKALFGGIGQRNKPGAIVVFKIAEDQARGVLKMDKIGEIQAHATQIERMRLSYDNTHLFTSGKDCCLMIHDVKDRDPKGKGRDRESLQFSDEILTEKQEIDQYIQEKEQLENDYGGQNSESFDKVLAIKKLDDQINKKQEDLSSNQLQHRNRYDSLNENKRDMEAAFEERIRNLAESHQIELEEYRNQYSQKMLEDAAKFQELQAKKDEEARNFEETIAEVIETHNQTVNKIMDKHRSLMEGQIAQTEQLQKEIERQGEDNTEILRQIEDDAQMEEEEIENNNTQNVKQVNEMSLKSKAELQLTNSKLADLTTDIDNLRQKIIEKDIQLGLQRDEEQKLRDDIKKKNLEIMERDTMIGDKEKRIYSLKKKTQELEKFKFVLDYKIRELKRDIAPRGMEINRLSKETREMDKQLRHYNKINANLGYIVDDLRTRQEKMQAMIKSNRAKIRSNDIMIKDFSIACYWTVQYIDDFDELKKAVNDNLYPYVKDQEMKNVEIDPDIKKEYENQRRYLENSKNSLKKRLEKEKQIHKEDNMQQMKDNIKLIAMISELRAQVKMARSEEKQTKSHAKQLANKVALEQKSKGLDDEEGGMTQEQEILQKEIDAKDTYIDELQKRLMQAQQQFDYLAQQQQQM